MKNRQLFFFILLAGTWANLPAQSPGETRLAELKAKLHDLSLADSRYAEKVDVSVTNFPVSELIRSLAKAQNLSINVAFGPDKLVNCNLQQVPVTDILYFVCKEKSLEVEVTGGILSIIPYHEPETEPPVHFALAPQGEGVTFDFTDCMLESVAKKAMETTGCNIIIPQSLYKHRVSAYGTKMGMDEAVTTIAAVNGLQSSKQSDNTWSIYPSGRERAEPDGHPFNPGGAVRGSQSTVEVVPMKYRTVDKVPEYIPAGLKANVEIITFPDLNSLVVNGDPQSVADVVHFLDGIDKSVPMVTFDVIIVDATDKTSQSIGLSLGKGTEPSVTKGSISPGVNLSLSAASVNRIINSFNGFGSINLGKVTSNFYADLKFLEDAGKIILRSTPRLSTLNGHKAVLKSGEVKYYKESQVNIIGTQNPLQSESYLWKDVEANFVLEITPYVSLDSVITLQINLDQAEFTVRESSDEDAPPGMTKRSFNSIIKVKDQEMVLLGGIEKSLTDTSSRGLPFLARIPVLRLLFGSTTKIKSTEKLNVFIRPVIIQ